MSRFGIIIKTSDGRAVVRTSRRGVCESCSERETCTFETALGKDVPEEVEVLNPINASTGDAVEFDLPGHSELKVSLLIWAVPLAGLILGGAAGALAGDALGVDPNLTTLAGVAVGLAAGMLPVILMDRAAASDPKYTPRVIRVVPVSTCPTSVREDAP